MLHSWVIDRTPRNDETWLREFALGCNDRLPCVPQRKMIVPSTPRLTSLRPLVQGKVSHSVTLHAGLMTVGTGHRRHLEKRGRLRPLGARWLPYGKEGRCRFSIGVMTVGRPRWRQRKCSSSRLSQANVADLASVI